MIIDWQQIVNLIITAGFATVGYFYTQIVSEQKRDRQMLNDLRVDLPSKYVSKDDLTSHLNRIEAMLTKIFDRLEQKVDKPRVILPISPSTNQRITARPRHGTSRLIIMLPFLTKCSEIPPVYP